MLTAVDGLKGGADYLTKPFAFSELVARGDNTQTEVTTLSLADLEVNPITRKATRSTLQLLVVYD